MRPDDLDPLLIDRVLADAASPADQAAVAAWAAADPRRGEWLAALRAASARGPRVDVDAAWSQLATRLSPATVRAITSARSQRPDPRRRRLAAVAAVAAVALVSVIGWRRYATMELSAPLGQRVSATLPDGSTITLSAGSRARWPRRFTPRRDVQLDGEAYFDVVHDAAHPFRVLARHGIARDVGTRFVVRAWPERAVVDVAVDEGIVDLSSATSRTVTRLVAGQRGAVDSAGRVVVTPDAATVLSWVRGELVFDNAPVGEALAAIGRWYGVTLRADEAMASRRLSARFAQQSLEQLLDALGLALDARVTRTGPVITLSPH
ncbi:MAG: FecR domain-containing protein [Gemmatimonadaceae bacterium]|nr:FecR domain-containing protein [Gemmatimonadaceae bacterium]